jgi:hypothetical protein
VPTPVSSERSCLSLSEEIGGVRFFAFRGRDALKANTVSYPLSVVGIRIVCSGDAYDQLHVVAHVPS